MLLIARCGRRGWRCCAGCRRLWSLNDGQHAGLPGIALTDVDRRPVAFSLLHRTVLALHCGTPFAEPPGLIACLAQDRRSFLIGFGQMVAIRTFWNKPSSHFSKACLP
jgi:hypothetical protein